MDKILFFDGYCSLCNGLVDWMIRRDLRLNLKFASIQGETAQKILPAARQGVGDPNTIIYFRSDKILDQSSAVLWSLSDIGGTWRIVLIFLVVPKFFRDFFYQLVARNRYRFFARRETCRVPKSEERERLLP